MSSSPDPQKPQTDAEAAADERATLTFWEMLSSTLWAAVGVQSRKNRTRDFQKGKAIHFIYFGIGFTVVFVVGMFLLVRLVLSMAGA